MSIDEAWARANAANPNFEVAELRRRGDDWLAMAWATDDRKWGIFAEATATTPEQALDLLARGLAATPATTQPAAPERGAEHE